MLKIRNLNKSYDKLDVLENINFEVPKGELLGIIGSNGAGKTTLLNSIMSNLDFDGEILIDGISNCEFIDKYRDDILFLPDQVFTYSFLTGLEFIKFILDMKKIHFADVSQNVKLLFQLFNLDDRLDSLIRDYSHGMKRKIALISVLVQAPKILLLDEPVSGLDTMSLIALKKILITMSKRGTTIIFSTHILDFVENMCDSILVINDKHATKIDGVNTKNKKEIENIFLQIVGSQIDMKIGELKLNTL
ncbi:MAG: ABC transporter ATP-binding protein [Melioribacteraceae bacterium]|nr:ABC transporter ATP-binding protein [Melioribacteraceae bacterium]MCF8393065.1 ABC transporter ATP-binding protein [Melioribacteraceae bacterium]MCF8419183.1 ABC transporter ATP-binding protein [Melioribacteraceae bacterium]